MNASSGLLMMFIALGVGCVHGRIIGANAYRTRIGKYERGDEYFVGGHGMIVISVLFVLRLAQSHVEFGRGLREGFWPLGWAIMYNFGVFLGYRAVSEDKPDE